MQNNQIMNNVAAAIEKEGISAFRFDFSGNGYVHFLALSLFCISVDFIFASIVAERVKAVSIMVTMTMKLMIYILLSNTSLTRTVWFLSFSGIVREVMLFSSMPPSIMMSAM